MNKEWGVRRIAVLVPYEVLEGKRITTGDIRVLVEEELLGGGIATWDGYLGSGVVFESTDWDYCLEKEVRRKGFRVLAMIDLLQFRPDPEGGSRGLVETAALEKARAGPRGYGQEHA